MATTPIERMTARRVVSEHGCWLWPGSGRDGYGQIRDTTTRQLLSVHRVSYEHFHGTIPAGMQVDHMCHTAECPFPPATCPHRRCWNPNHLQLLDNVRNSARSKAPGALAVASGYCQRGEHARTPENLIVGRRPNGRSYTQCRPCKNARRVPKAA